MNRRTLLRQLGIVGVATAFLGAGTATATTVTNTKFRSSPSRTCTAGDAVVSTRNNKVFVDGCFDTQDACTDPALSAVTYDAPTDTLTVEIGSVRNDAEICTPSVRNSDYTATVGVRGGLPGRVVVIHDNFLGRTVVADVTLSSSPGN